MLDFKDPAIKLFGKTISLPFNPHLSPTSPPPPPLFSTTSFPDDTSQGLQPPSQDQKPLEGQEFEGKEEDGTSRQTSEELKDPTASPGVSENPETPSADKETSKDGEQSEISGSQEKTLKKPDKILPCPRCTSMDTKFCYYNNYNLSQPRHFCKSCRRYWTQGGTLRNIPVGGGTRKNSKRSRTATSSSSSTLETTPANPISVSPVLKAETETPQRNGLSLNGDVSGGFTSLLNSQGPGFLALNGFSLGLGPGFDEMGFGPAKGVWSYPDVGDVVLGGDGTGSGGGSASSSICNTWQLSGGEVGFVDGDCFAWPDLAISTPGQGLK